MIVIRVRDDQAINREPVTGYQVSHTAHIVNKVRHASLRLEEAGRNLDGFTKVELQFAEPKPKAIEPQDNDDYGGKPQHRLDQPDDHGVTIHASSIDQVGRRVMWPLLQSHTGGPRMLNKRQYSAT
jgi:hypothetical protein